MLVSTRGRYALRLMLTLAENNHKEYLRLDTIAELQEISEKYLESIVRILVKAKMIEGLRGRGGGYRLTRNVNEYSVGEILRLTEGSLAPVSCLDCKPNPCNRADKCKILPMWERLDTMICDYLNHITLADLQTPSPADRDTTR